MATACLLMRQAGQSPGERYVHAFALEHAEDIKRLIDDQGYACEQAKHNTAPGTLCALTVSLPASGKDQSL